MDCNRRHSEDAESEDARRSSRRALLVVIGLVLLLCALSRCVSLADDPPAWLQESFLQDGCWWANSARNCHFFGDHFTDNYGSGYLMAPVYTWSLQAVYAVFGVGLTQTRALAAACSFLTVLISAWILWKLAGPREALVCAILLTVSPFFWANGRITLLEPMQTFFIVASFALWAGPTRSLAAGAASGLTMALAVGAKLNALIMGFVPLFLVGALMYFSGPPVYFTGPPAADSRERRLWKRRTFQRAALALIAFVGGAAFIFWVMMLPNWDRFLKMALDQALWGKSHYWFERLFSVGGKLFWSTQFEGGEYKPVLWRIALWSPAAFVGVWLFLLIFLSRFRDGVRRSWSALEFHEKILLLWFIGTWIPIATNTMQLDHRYVPLIPGMAMLASLALCRLWRERTKQREEGDLKGRLGFWLALVYGAILTLPVLVVLKPVCGRLVMDMAAHVKLGEDPGVNHGVAGVPVVAVWLMLLVLWARFRKSMDRAATSIRRLPWLILIAALILFEISTVCSSVYRGNPTQRDWQVRLEDTVKEGDVAVGLAAASLFLPAKVQVVQPMRPFDTERPRFPTYRLEMKGRNHVPVEGFAGILESALNDGYQPLMDFELGPYRSKIPRFQFVLLHKREDR